MPVKKVMISLDEIIWANNLKDLNKLLPAPKYSDQEK